MSRLSVLSWTYSLLIIIITLASTPRVINGAIGANFGTQASHTLSPSILVQLLRDNGISKVKLFDSDSWYIGAFAGTDIEVMPGIPNKDLQRLSDHYGDAQDWVEQNVTKHIGRVKIKYVAVGNEPFLKGYSGSYLKTTLPAIKNIQKALDEAGHTDIKATTPLNADVYDGSVPSAGDFRSDIKPLMVSLVRYLNSVDSPFIVNIYPFLSFYQESSSFPIEYAMFEGGSQGVDDKGTHYDNMLDANLDTLSWSLKKAGVPKLKIIIGEIGWPTDGDVHANISLAKQFYNGLFKKMASNKGTPQRPGPMDYYIFGLIDEDMKSIAPGTFERHWGMFYYDGKPKFNVDMSGKGNNQKSIVPAKGVEYLDKSWCVYNTKNKDLSKIGPAATYACLNGDCTSLEYGSTCNNLRTANQNVSYAFNMFYQMNDQSVEACDFDGIATITTKDPSTDTCRFIVQIQSGGMRSARYDRLNALVGILVMVLFTALF